MQMTRSRGTYATRHKDQRVAHNADQAEFNAILTGATPLTAGIQDDAIADSLQDYDLVDPQDVATWAETDMRVDSAVNDIGLEVERRSQILGLAYPFDLQKNCLIYRPSVTQVYEFCLAASLTPSLSAKPYNRIPAAFERLARDVLLCFLGKGAEAMRTGSPPDEFEPEQPASFRETCKLLNKLTGEWIWRSRSDLPEEPTTNECKDEGIDFVVWKKMPDGRRGHLFVIGQCACGLWDWSNKTKDLDPEIIERNWLESISVAPAVRAFATPHHIANDRYFTSIGFEAGLTLDRARIVALAEHPDHCSYIKTAMKDPYDALAKLVIYAGATVKQGTARRPRKGVGARRSQSQESASEHDPPETQLGLEIPGEPHTPDS